MNRRLTIKSETLAELTTDELGAVAGAQTLTGYYPTLEAAYCTRIVGTLLTGTTTTSF